MQATRNTMGAKFFEYVQGIRHLKSYGQTGERNKELLHSFENLRRKSIWMEALPGPIVITTTIIFEVCFLIMVALVLYYLSGNSITIPVLITFFNSGLQPV